jgi:hypothetical protein
LSSALWREKTRDKSEGTKFFGNLLLFKGLYGVWLWWNIRQQADVRFSFSGSDCQHSSFEMPCDSKDGEILYAVRLTHTSLLRPAKTVEMAATVAIDKDVEAAPAGRKLRLVKVSLRLHSLVILIFFV